MKTNFQLSLLVGLHILACIFYDTMLFIPFWMASAGSSLSAAILITKSNWKPPSALHSILLTLCMALPCLWMTPDDDINRYLWEGRVSAEGYNPYQLAPNDQQLSEIAQGMKDHPVNHPEWTSIYGPFFTYLLTFLTFIGGGILSIKLLWLGLHILNTFLIKQCSANPKASTLYGFSSFILLETVGLGHMEQLLISGCLLLIYGIQCQRDGLFFIGSLISLWVKWWLIPLFPLIIKLKQWKSLVFTLSISFLLCLPFLDAEWTLFKSLFAFSDLWSHGYLYRPLDFLLGDFTKLFITFILAIRAIQMFFLGGRLSHQLLDLMRLGIWLSPTIHPWYATLPLALCLIEGRLATFALCSAFFVGMHDAEFELYHQGVWQTSWICGLPAFILFMLPEHFLRKTFFLESGPWVKTFSIVTPTLNESQNLHELGDQLKQHQEHIAEWIIVDGGSQDDSLAVAASYQANVLQAQQKGRGHQIREGIDAAKEDWIVIIHGDTRITPNFFNDCREAIYRHPGVVGGAFQMAYREYKHLGPLQFLNTFKTAYLGISFGDQSQFIHRPSLQAHGGFPDIPLMEDVELSLIWQGQTTAFIRSSKSLTSPRRWKKKGRLKNALVIIHLLLQYFWRRQVFGQVDTKKLYKQYYN